MRKESIPGYILGPAAAVEHGRRKETHACMYAHGYAQRALPDTYYKPPGLARDPSILKEKRGGKKAGKRGAKRGGGKRRKNETTILSRLFAMDRS